MAQLLPTLRHRFIDANGDALAGGKLYSYQAGTSTPLSTYVDQTEVTPNTNPIILDTNGECVVWLGTSNYKFVLKDLNDVVQWSEDNVSQNGVGAVGTLQLANGSVTAAKIASDAVTTIKILDSNVTTAKINALAVTSAKLAADAVTTVKILDANVTTAKIADAAITKAKLASLGQQLSSSSGTFTTASSSLVDVTNLTCTITTTGRPVLAMMVHDGGSNSGYIENDNTSSSAVIACKRDTTQIALIDTDYNRKPASAFCFYDAPAAGTYTYKIQAARNVLISGNTHVYYAKLLVFEL